MLALCIAALAVLLLVLSPRDRSVLTQSYKTTAHGGLERKYLVSAPSKTTAQSKVIVGLHGYTDSARRFAYYTGLHNAAGSNDVVVYPQAVKPLKDQQNGWNSGFCCGSGWKQSVDDAAFIMHVAQLVKDQYNLGPAKVYIAGFSNGAFMTQRLATDYPGDIAAVAVSSGSIGTEEKRLQPRTPIPILLMHGEKDETVPFNGGFKDSDPEFIWLPFSDTKATWQNVNGDTAEVKVITYPENGHKWGDWRLLNFWHKKPQASIEVIKFFSK